MKTVKITLFTLVSACILTINTYAQSSSAYIHEALGSTITFSKTILDTSVLNGNSNMILMLTHNYNPGGGVGVYFDKVLGFRFQSLKWYITTQDVSPFLEDTHLNVFIPGTDSYSWIHSSTNANISGNSTIIDDGRINNNPNAHVFVSNNLANFNNQVNGIYYNIAISKWCIFNQAGNNEDMDKNLDFNIIVPKGNTGYEHFIHTANANNTSNHFTYINHPEANSNPDAIIFVTQVWNPGGTVSGIYNNHNVGVQYRSNNKWVIYNEDLVNMPMGASFNVMVFRNNTIGIDELSLNTENVKIFPNPATAGNTTSVVLDKNLSGTVNIEVYSISGQLVLKSQFDKTQTEQIVALNTASLVPGMYVLKVESQGKVGAQRLIIH